MASPYNSKVKHLTCLSGVDAIAVPSDIPAMPYFNIDASMKPVVEKLSQNDISTGSFDLEPDVNGVESATATCSVQLNSFGSEDPADYDLISMMKACNLEYAEQVVLEFDAVANAVVGGPLLGGTSAATGFIEAIYGLNIVARVSGGTFSGSESVTTTSSAVIGTTTDTSATYSLYPNGNTGNVCSLVMFTDGYSKFLKNGVGNFSLSAEAGQIPAFSFDFIGQSYKTGWADNANPTYTRGGLAPVAVKGEAISIYDRTDGAEVVDICLMSIEHGLGNTTTLYQCWGEATGVSKGYVGDVNGAALTIMLKQPDTADFDAVTSLFENKNFDITAKIGQWYLRFSVNISDVEFGTTDMIETITLIAKPIKIENIGSFLYSQVPTA